MKRITLEIEDDVHARLVAKAAADDRSLVKYLMRLLASAAQEKGK